MDCINKPLTLPAPVNQLKSWQLKGFYFLNCPKKHNLQSRLPMSLCLKYSLVQQCHLFAGNKKIGRIHFQQCCFPLLFRHIKLVSSKNITIISNISSSYGLSQTLWIIGIGDWPAVWSCFCLVVFKSFFTLVFIRMLWKTSTLHCGTWSTWERAMRSRWQVRCHCAVRIIALDLCMKNLCIIYLCHSVFSSQLWTWLGRRTSMRSPRLERTPLCRRSPESWVSVGPGWSEVCGHFASARENESRRRACPRKQRAD